MAFSPVQGLRSKPQGWESRRAGETAGLGGELVEPGELAGRRGFHANKFLAENVDFNQDGNSLCYRYIA